MGDFAIQFMICNLWACVMSLLFFTARRLLFRRLDGKTRHRLWFLPLALLFSPFLPAKILCAPQFFLRLFFGPGHAGGSLSAARAAASPETYGGAAGWMSDFGTAVSQKSPSVLGLALFAAWTLGMAASAASLLLAARRLRSLRRSSLPLRHPALRELYRECREKMGVSKDLPVRSSEFLRSPVLAGLFFPCIYLPARLVSDFNAADMRYMLLHELSHYRRKDLLTGAVANFAGMLYWFNPLARHMLREMRADAEIACDAGVLEVLDAGSYEAYGNALLDFAESVSRAPAPFCAGISGSMEQMRERILHIAHYRKPSFQTKMRGAFICAAAAALLSGFLPVLMIRAEESGRYDFHASGTKTARPGLAGLFGSYEGCFVLHDAKNDAWQIYNEAQAVTRRAPLSTYKIYGALLGLNKGIISPSRSVIAWDGQRRRYDEWNKDLTLADAMRTSATWYFQSLDRQAGLPAVQDFIREIGYGSQDAGDDVSSYWADTLTISPVEQVELLEKFYSNAFDFPQENIDAVKRSIYACPLEGGALYGKTGTAETNGKNTSGWFVGYLEKDGNAYFFASYIQNEDHATGSAAKDLAVSALSLIRPWN